MTKLEEAKAVLKRAGYKVSEGSFDPKRFEYSRGRQGDNNPNTAAPTGNKYSKTGNIHEGEGARAFLEAKALLAKAGYKVVREKSGLSVKKVLEAKALLAKAGYKLVREEYTQDIEHPSNISVPSLVQEYPDSAPGTNTGDQENSEQTFPAESHEKGDLHEALEVLKKAGIPVKKDEKLAEALAVLKKAGVKVLKEFSGDLANDPFSGGDGFDDFDLSEPTPEELGEVPSATDSLVADPLSDFDDIGLEDTAGLY